MWLKISFSRHNTRHDRKILCRYTSNISSTVESWSLDVFMTYRLGHEGGVFCFCFVFSFFEEELAKVEFYVDKMNLNMPVNEGNF